MAGTDGVIGGIHVEGVIVEFTAFAHFGAGIFADLIALARVGQVGIAVGESLAKGVVLYKLQDLQIAQIAALFDIVDHPHGKPVPQAVLKHVGGEGLAVVGMIHKYRRDHQSVIVDVVVGQAYMDLGRTVQGGVFGKLNGIDCHMPVIQAHVILIPMLPAVHIGVFFVDIAGGDIVQSRAGHLAGGRVRAQRDLEVFKVAPAVIYLPAAIQARLGQHRGHILRAVVDTVEVVGQPAVYGLLP